jgi:hypothetical protein
MTVTGPDPAALSDTAKELLRIIAAWRDGAADAELHDRAYAGEFTPEGAPDLRLPAPE